MKTMEIHVCVTLVEDREVTEQVSVNDSLMINQSSLTLGEIAKLAVEQVAVDLKDRFDQKDCCCGKEGCDGGDQGLEG